MKPNKLQRLSSRVLLIMLMLFASERVWSQEFTPYLKSLNAKFRIDGHVYSPIGSNQLSGTPPDTGVFADWIDSSSASPARKGLLRSNGAMSTNLNSAYNFYTKLYKDPQNTTDDQFDGGNKVFNNPNNWGFKWSNSGVLAKDDINNLGVHFTRDYGDSVWAIFSSDRRTTNGTSYVDFELYQKAITQTYNGNNNTGTFTSLGTDCGRTKGDILITVQYTGGGRVDSIFFYTWDVFTGSGGCNGFNWKRVYPPSYTAFGYSNVVTNNQTRPLRCLTVLLALQAMVLPTNLWK